MLREVLDKTAQRAANDLTNQPEVAADLFLIIGKTYDELGQYTNALAVTRESLRLRRFNVKEESPRNRPRAPQHWGHPMRRGRF